MTEEEMLGVLRPVFTRAEAWQKLPPLMLETDVDWLTEQGCLIAVTTTDGQRLWPGFQFMLGWTRPAVSPLLWTFAAVGPDPWALAIWLNTPTDRLGGLSPAQSLDPVAAIQLANETAARWNE